jgi:hypothetical protein
MTPRQARQLAKLASATDGLAEEYESLITDSTLQALEERIVDGGGVAVLRSRTTVAGDRVMLLLDGGIVLELRLLVPQRTHLGIVLSARRRCSATCIVRGRTADGDHVTYVASELQITHAA